VKPELVSSEHITRTRTIHLASIAGGIRPRIVPPIQTLFASVAKQEVLVYMCHFWHNEE
jgi:hypothetical protein